MIRNSHNWAALYRALWVSSNPVQFASPLIARRDIRLLRNHYVEDLRLLPVNPC
jgi:hypothetical protein